MQPDEKGNYWQGSDEDAAGASPTDNSVKSVAPLAQDEIEEDDDSPFQPISWEASEYIHHERDTLWFSLFLIITVVFLVVSIFLVKNYFFTALIVVMSVALFLYVRRPPEVLRYTLSSRGLNIGQKFHPFKAFRAFGIVQDGALLSVKLLPTARFGQELTIYFAENDGEQIVDILGAYLPMEDLHLDLVDALLRRLRL